MTVKVAIVYRSAYGHTAGVAGNVAQGARDVQGVEAALYKAEDLSNPDQGPRYQLVAADAIIFGAPTCMGAALAPSYSTAFTRSAA